MASWHALSYPSFAFAFPITPIPYLGATGVVLSVAAGFAPAFRLNALRGFEQLPPAILGPARPSIERLRLLERAELAIALVIAVGAVLATFAAFGPWIRIAYLLAVPAWWVVAVFAQMAQVRLADFMSRLLIDPTLLPIEVPDRIVRRLWIALGAGLAGAALLVFGAVRVRGAPLVGAEVALLAAWPLVLAALALQVHCAIGTSKQAMMLAECVFESDFFRPRRGRPVVEAEPEEDRSAVPPSQRHAFTPRPSDDAPIRLPGE